MARVISLYDLMLERHKEINVLDRTYEDGITIYPPNACPASKSDYYINYYDFQFLIEFTRKILVEVEESGGCERVTADWTGFFVENREKVMDFRKEHWGTGALKEEEFVLRCIALFDSFTGNDYCSPDAYRDWLNPFVKCLKGQQDMENHADNVGQDTEQEMSKDLPEMCYAFVELDGVVLIKRGEHGFCKTSEEVKDEEAARAFVAMKNNAMGITKEQELAMQYGSLFGWNQPKAEPAFYEKENLLEIERRVLCKRHGLCTT